MKQYYSHGVNPDGTQWTATTADPAADTSSFSLHASGYPWSKTTTDFLGRPLAEERPAFGGGTLITSNLYSTASHLRQSALICGQTLISQTLHVYDDLGALVQTVQDLDFDGQVDLAGPDRISESRSGYALRAAASWPDGLSLADGWWTWQASITYPDGTVPFTNTVSWSRLTGLGQTSDLGLLCSESVTIDVRGNHAVSRLYLDRDSLMETRVAISPASTEPALAQTYNGLPFASSDTHGHRTLTAHDALRRPVATQDAHGATHSRGYDSKGRVAWESDPATNGTWFAYDSLGRRTAVTNALGQVTHTAYDSEGRAIATWGATYPVAYEYDQQGRMVAMATTRDPDLAEVNLWEAVPNWPLLTANCPLDRTRWLYDQPTGLLTNKLYADGKGTAYSYTPDGQLATRTWARGVVTSYAFDSAGSLTNITYSDATPAVSLTHDRLGRVTFATVAGVSTNAYTYNPATLALSAEAQNGVELERTTDSLGRDTGFVLGPDYAVRYGFDAYGRLSSVSSSVASVSSVAQYSRLPNTDLISGMAGSSGFLWTRAYEPARSLVTSVENRFGETVISRYDYANDEIGRRTAISRSGQAFGDMPVRDAYGYNLRSEVTSARRTLVDTPSQEVRGFSYDYEYDPIGNRIASTEYDHEDNAIISSYTANALNQYEQRTVPGYAGVHGTATNTAVVTVNGNPTWRLDDYFNGGDEADNALSAIMKELAITAVYNPPGTNAPDVVTSATGHVFVAHSPEQFTYDDDGSLTRDGRFVYAWNGENRLIVAETRDDLPASVPRVKVEYAYDYRGRMVWKRVSTNDVVASTRRLLWDGWNLMSEVGWRMSDVSTNFYVWGLDLSGSLQGAGGVGGLLAEVQNGAPYCAAFDANGNVTEYLATDGTIAAHYEYDPFGAIVVQTGCLAERLTHRFSTKPWCPITGLSEYLFRKFGPGMGRWMSRDPTGERPSPNRSASCHNDPINLVDPLGLFDKKVGKDGLVDITVYHCEIVILDGHGGPLYPHRFAFATNECVGAVFVGCHPGVTNGEIPPEFLVPGACMDKPQYPGDRSSEKTDMKGGTLPPLREAVYYGAQEMAKRMCDCCYSVTVTFTSTVPVPKFWQFGAQRPRKETVYVYDCETSTWTRQPGGQDGYPIYGSR